MSAIPAQFAREVAPPQPVANGAWYLHSQGRQFGPLDEDEMRRYFRAGMVHAGDTIAIAGQHGTVPAADAAALLGMPPPMPAAASQHVRTSILITETGEGTSKWLKLLGAIVVILGVAYFTLHVPLRPLAELKAVVMANEAGSRELAAIEAIPAPAIPTVQASPAQPPVEAPPPDVTPIPEPASATASAPPMTTLVSQAVYRAPAARPRVVANAPDERRLKARRLTDVADWNALVAHASEWTSSQPGSYAPWFYLGLGHAHLGNWDRANEAFDRAVAITPDRFSTRLRLANVYLETNRYQEAVRLLTELSAERPDHADVWNDLGVAQANLGEYDDSVAALEKAVQLEPDHRLAWGNLSWAHAKFGYKDRAKAVRARANGR